MSAPPFRVVVVGNGMVGHKLIEAIVEADGLTAMHVTVLGDEPRPAYDRVALSSYFEGRGAEDLSLVAEGFFDDPRITLHLGTRATVIDRAARTVTCDDSTEHPYNHLVLATGSAPFVPPIDGNDQPGCFVYRTIEDLDAIAAAAGAQSVRTGVVIGGGLLGLEAANALLQLGLDTHVVEFAPRLMPVQLDDGGGQALRRHIEALGVHVHTDMRTTGIVAEGGRLDHLTFDGAPDLHTDLVVFSAGIRPRDQLARDAGLDVGERGGIAVDDTLRTEDHAISAIGECACVDGRVFGLVAPGYQMARVLATHLVAISRGDPTPADRFAATDLSTKLKLLGVEVASAGDPHRSADDSADHILWNDPVTGVYRKVIIDRASGRAVGGVLVGDAAGYNELVQAIRADAATEAPWHLVLPQADSTTTGAGTASASPDALICSCENVCRGAIASAVAEGCADVAATSKATRAGTGCGGCVPLLTTIVRDELSAAGVEIDTSLCEHFPMSRVDLFDLARVRRHTTFAEMLEAYGTGFGCDICKPAVASILASLGGGYILDDNQAALQDTNDHFLANMQRDGTYSVVPRVPGGEITPDKLIVLGEVARDFDLYTKITGGQRIDLFGARVDQLPTIWRRLVDAGFESGHAYGKAMRTVKSCVGQSWCRYGVQDSTAMAIRLEERYRGLRAPHKIKLAVSGCARECAEAQSKDVGVIATERGWNLYVGGNGGMRPRHADLFAEDVDDDTLIRLIDRFLLFYVRTADRLERTAPWVARFDGGLERLRRVVIDDELGLADELEAAMQHHVDHYACEWRLTLEDPDCLRQFVTFVNAPDKPDPTVVFVRERQQIRPATADERHLADALAAVQG